MTFEDFLEKWNLKFSKEITEWLETLEYSGSHQEIISEALSYAIAYADYFDTDAEILRFLKAICIRVIFQADGDLADVIESQHGRLWKRCLSSLSTNPRRIARLTLELEYDEVTGKLKYNEVTEIFQDFACLGETVAVRGTKGVEKRSIDNLLFAYMRSQISTSRSVKNVATAIRYEMERALIPRGTE